MKFSKPLPLILIVPILATLTLPVTGCVKQRVPETTQTHRTDATADSMPPADADRVEKQHVEKRQLAKQQPEELKRAESLPAKPSSKEPSNSRVSIGKKGEVPADESRAVEISLESLVERLKNSDAIGFLTKLAIRSDVLDFQALVASHRKMGTFEENRELLRSRFDGLVLKILALLARDPELSREIYLARGSIWKSLIGVKS